MKFKGIKPTIIREYKNYQKNKNKNIDFTINQKEKDILSTIRKDGLCVIPNFISTEKANEIKQEVDGILTKYADKIWIDDAQSDHRAWGANLGSDLITKEFLKNEFIDRIVNTYEGKAHDESLTLAAKLTANNNNKGSGGGWHRDRPDCKQTKAILYLTDVEKENGPFQYIIASHNSSSIIKNQIKYGFKTDQYRFEDFEINQIIKDTPHKLKTFTAKAGTLIIADVRGFHRGMPIQKGERYALTNYYWVDEPMHSGIKKMLIQ